MLGFLRVPFAALIAFILFFETLSKVEVFGATVIVASSCLIYFNPQTKEYLENFYALNKIRLGS